MKGRLMRNWIMAATFGVALMPWAAWAEGSLRISGAHALVTADNAQTAAIFMEIANGGAVDDRLIGVETGVADASELHTHVLSAEGLMQMLPVEDGFAVAAGDTRALSRGGDHVMLMGLRQAMPQGTKFTVTLTFEEAGKVVVVVPVQDAAEGTGHSGHGTAAPASE
jgi:periplasmic copper chaperone A